MTPRLILLALIALVLPTATARADKLNVGVFVPSAPFASTSARQDYATRLAAHLAAATGDDGVGRVYARASDLASALKKGELDVALVDAAYLAAIGSPHPVLATATRDGKTSISWQLVTTGTETTIPELKGTTLQVAAIGGREAAFVNDALLGAELPADFFASVETSPDVASVLAALTLGKVHAAVVPGGVALPAGVRTVGTLDEVPWPALIASSALDARRRDAIADASGRFVGGDVLGGFHAGGGDAIRALARRFTRTPRRGPMAVPRADVAVDELVAARKPRIRRAALLPLIAAPAALPEPGQ